MTDLHMVYIYHLCKRNNDETNMDGCMTIILAGLHKSVKNLL